MILVFDTNALISAFITAGPSRDVFEYAARNHHVVTSSYILGELTRKVQLGARTGRAQSARHLGRQSR